VALAVVLAAVGVIGTTGADKIADVDRPVDVGAFLLAVAAAAVLVVRHRWPAAVLVAVAVAIGVYLGLAYPYGPVMATLLVAVYTAARWLPPRRSAPAAAAGLVILLMHLFTHPQALPGLLGVVPASAWVVAPFAVGVAVRVQRESIARGREEAIRQRVYDERLRVAREVHDVVGHGLAAITMQANVALHLLARKPEQAEAALTAISRASSEALDELRATLAVVRRDGSGSARSPGLARLDELRERMGAAGVEVRLHTTGSPPVLPATVDLAGYRVVQESLTNVLRHSDAKVATVRIGYDTDRMSIAVSNPAPGAPDGTESTGPEPTGPGGVGIPGMRERVTALGGTFTAGRTEDGRFEVRASLPTDGRP